MCFQQPQVGRNTARRGGGGGLPVNPEEQLLLRQTRLLLPLPRRSTCLTAASLRS